jgi:putative ABC transport system substrate-binding protein
MRRRDLLPLLAALAAARPFAAGAQQPRVPVVGFLSASARDPQLDEVYLGAWRKALAEAGFVEGHNLAVEYRLLKTDPTRFLTLAVELAGRPVDLIMTTSGAAAVAAKQATATIPIVFTGATDPIGAGLVERLNRPGGNITGVAGSFEGLVEKRLELLREVVPTATRIGYLDTDESKQLTAIGRPELERILAAGKMLGVEIVPLTVATPEEIETAIADARQRGIGAIVVALGPFMYAQQERIIEQLARYRLPGVRQFGFAEQGGLLSYGPDFGDIAYQGGSYVARILRGAKPADLPVMQPTKLKLVINMKTANALGLTVPPTLLARADEVIE